jgi:predicted O-linked N-acetylglucosamine transferase (SPINDLY family)
MANIEAAFSALQSNNYEQAWRIAKSLIEKKQSEADAYHVLAIVAMNKNEQKMAEDCLHIAINKNQENHHYWNSLGSLLRNQQRFAESEKAYLRALSLNKKDPINLHLNLTLLYYHDNQPQKSLLHAKYATDLHPQNPDGWMMRGVALQQLGRYHDSIICHERAMNLEPAKAKHPNNLGNIFTEQKNFPLAVFYYEQAVALDEKNQKIWINLCSAYENMEDIEQTRQAYARMLEKAPCDAALLRQALLIPTIFSSKAELENERQALEMRIKALEERHLKIEEPEEELTRFPFYHAYHGKNDRPFLESLERILRKSCPPLSYDAGPFADKKTAETTIRLGVISKYFHDSIVAKCYQPILLTLLQEHKNIEIICYAASAISDSCTDELVKNGAKIILLNPKNLSYSQKLIAADKCDALLYLDIGMDPFTYLLAFARLAPVQCTIGGHPLTSGLKTIDYYISSSPIEPENAAEHYTEKLVLLQSNPGTGPRAKASATSISRSDIGLSNMHRIYLCPVLPHKLHPDFYDVLSAILNADSNAQIVLFQSERISALTTQSQNILRHHLGKFSDRLIFLPWQQPENFAQILRLADAVLDPWHFSMGSTCYILFELGIPVVTWPGEFMRGRTAYALYQRMNISDLIAKTQNEYVPLALKLACDQELKKQMHDQIKKKHAIIFNHQPATSEIANFLSIIANKKNEKAT